MQKLVKNHDYCINKDLFIRYSNVHFKQIHQGAKLSIGFRLKISMHLRLIFCGLGLYEIMT
jgi:hypothetical protein